MSGRGAHSGALGVSETTESVHCPSPRRLHLLSQPVGVGADSSRARGRVQPGLSTSVTFPGGFFRADLLQAEPCTEVFLGVGGPWASRHI